jgi:NAD-dependent SIR2 family protein deacetylase
VSDKSSTAQARCFRCEKPVSSEDIAAGIAYVRDNYYVCPACIDDVRKGHLHTDSDTMKSQLAALTAEVRNISQHLHYEEFSWLFVVGGILQVVVLLILYRSYQAVEPVPALLWGVIVQLMAITAFIVGKLK